MTPTAIAAAAFLAVFCGAMAYGVGQAISYERARHSALSEIERAEDDELERWLQVW